MPVPDNSGPRPAFCEDYDDEAGTTISSSRATAQLAVKQPGTGVATSKVKFKQHNDGSDSGYSSKTGTINSEPTGPKRPTDLRVETSVPERERHPYSMSSQARPKHQRESSSRPKGVENGELPGTAKPFVHPRGVCMTCDRYGRHLDDRELEQIHSQVPTPSSPKIPKKPASAASAKKEREAPLRRYSSSQDPRSTNVYPPSATQPQYAVNPAYVSSSGYATPITPTLPYSPSTYTYDPYASTPIAAAYAGYAGQGSYFEPVYTAKPQLPKSGRRSSFYAEDSMPKPQRVEDAVRTVKLPSKKESVSTSKTHKVQRSVDEDRRAMPPPERPTKVTQLAHRPSLKKTSTYDADIREFRRSRDEDEIDLPRPKPSNGNYDRDRSSQQPASRPYPARKSVSYSDPHQITKIAKTAPKEEPLSRRTTMPTTPLEQKEAEAEAYQRRRSKMTSDELTAERLSEMKKHTVSSKSETGSAFSHRESHQSSSKASSGRERSRTTGNRTSIVINGGLKVDIPDAYLDRKGRPVSINFDGLTISTGSKDKKPEQRLLEKAPSVASHTSRRSVTESSHGSPTKPRDRDHRDSLQSSRRPSHTDDRSRPPVANHGQRSSRQNSRASSTRASLDYGRNQRPSVDYDDGRLYYGA